MKLIGWFSRHSMSDPYPKRKLRGSPNTNRPTWKTVLTDVFYEYAEDTKLNGFYYLKRNISKGYVRYCKTFVHKKDIIKFSTTAVYCGQ